MSHKVLRKSGELHYLACEWGKRLLRYLPSVDTDVLSKSLASNLRGSSVSSVPFFTDRNESVNYKACLTISDRQPKITKTFLDNCSFIRSLMDLPKQTDSLVQFALLSQINQWLRALASSVHLQASHLSLNEIIKDITGVNDEQFIHATARLNQYGFLPDVDFSSYDFGEIPKALIRKLLTEKITSREMLVEPLLHPSPNAVFGLKDFPHVNTELLTRYLNAATQARSVGTSVLLYGDSGTGKTELSRALAKSCGRTLYEIRSTALASNYADDEFNSRFPNKDRLRYLSLLNSLLTNKSNAMLLVDECEGLFENADSQYSKEHLQRFIEQNDIPCIWITNYVQSLEVSFIRRFKLAIDVPSLKPEEIESVTRSYFRGLGLSLVVRKQISQVENITPAIVANATHIAHTIKAKNVDAEAVVNDVVEYSLRATEQWQDKLNYKGEIPFDVSYLNIKQPQVYLDDITYALKHNLPSRTLISGPPGTGKTAYAHYLAELNNRKLLRVKCSDVLSKWVGESERKIAELFQRAHTEEQVILLDEVDSLLSAREGLNAQHELQFVNEFLTQIECFTQPLFAATNFATKLDKAVLRRFDFKLDCQYLTSVQVLELYKQVTRVKRLSESESETLLQLKYLTPGDFAILARRTKFRPNASIRDFAINLLADENQRKQAKPQPGFIRPH